MNFKASRFGQFLLSLCMMLAFVNWSAAQDVDAPYGRTWGSAYRPWRPAAGATVLSQHRYGNAPADWIKRWNEIAINASGLDHTPPAPGETRNYYEQLGPGRSSRAMAIVHIAIFDALNAIVGGYKSYTGVAAARGATSLHAAIAQAAHDTLASLYPAQVVLLDAELNADLAQVASGPARNHGIELGQRAAAAILQLRATDGSDHAEPVVGIEFMTSNAPGMWRQDPISMIPIALGAYWGGVTPFVLRSGDQFRAPRPPELDSAAYADAFDEVKRVGGDGVTTPTQRTAEQTEIGIFWAYDGTPSLCAPTRLYNQIAVHIAELKHSNVIDLARLLALVNVTLADAGIAIWDSKYHYQYWRPITGIRESDPDTGRQYWRPITGIRESDPDTGPTGLGDGNGATIGDPAFSPLGAPASDLSGPNFTPPFPSYPSGHAGFGGALFQTLRRFYGTDDVPFTFVSDEFNGVTTDNNGQVRPLLPRSFSSLSEAEAENGQSRIYLGIHWAFDKTEGIAQGRAVADYVMHNAFAPVRGR